MTSVQLDSDDLLVNLLRAGGSRVLLRYEEGSPPVLMAKISALKGMAENLAATVMEIRDGLLGLSRSGDAK